MCGAIASGPTGRSDSLGRTSRLVRAGLLRIQVAGLLYAGKIEARGREFGDLRTMAGRDLHFEDVRSNQLTDGAFVHGKETAADPVPAVIAMRVVDANHDFHLRLHPETRAVGRAQPDAGIEVGVAVLAVGTDQFDARLVLRVLAEVVVGKQLKAHFLGAGHLL